MKQGECFVKYIGPGCEDDSVQYNLFRITDYNEGDDSVRADFMYVCWSEEDQDGDRDIYDDHPTEMQYLENAKPIPCELFEAVYAMVEDYEEEKVIFDYVDSRCKDLFPDQIVPELTDEEATKQLSDMGYEAARLAFEDITDLGRYPDFVSSNKCMFMKDGRPTPKAIGERLNENFWDELFGEEMDRNVGIYKLYKGSLEKIGERYFSGLRAFIKDTYGLEKW